jgi:hypothetical protein
VKRSAESRAPVTCHPYIERQNVGP